MADQNPASTLAPPPPSRPTFRAENNWTMRDAFMEKFHQRYPNINVTPRHDLDVILLSSLASGGPTPPWDGRMSLFDWLDNALNNLLSSYEDKTSEFHHMLAKWKPLLDEPYAIQTGIKPLPGTRNGNLIQVLPIPGSVYSVRLFPGNPLRREYCIDFVNAREEPINEPFGGGFRLWAVTDPAMPWLPSAMLRSVEEQLGLHDIDEGTEKFVVMDGQACILCRPGEQDVMFTVPIREEMPANPNVVILN
ncbi:hypothetical protein HGRIS_003839 [Hohenbuehelia grisea]|uniref:Uncharacterized protein n=1 Tax=Hohenbuehelia grisea TaxID=104357 RepID=A0ABR3JHA4_9AGAR